MRFPRRLADAVSALGRRAADTRRRNTLLDQWLASAHVAPQRRNGS